ncbi:hypothetical protein MASR2M78_22080 [Treponema sp.]
MDLRFGISEHSTSNTCWLPFHLSVLVDEKRIKPRIDPYLKFIKPRDILNISTQLFMEGKPLNVKPHIQALISQPNLVQYSLSSHGLLNFFSRRIERSTGLATLHLSDSSSPGLYHITEKISLDLGSEGQYERIVTGWFSVK